MSELISIEKLYQDRLWIITVTRNSHEAVDLWEQSVRQYIASVNDKPDRYLVYDLANLPNLSFTNYMRQRASILAKDNRDATGRVALVVRVTPTILFVFDAFIRMSGRQIQPHLDVKLFNNREKALEWVSAIVPNQV